MNNLHKLYYKDYFYGALAIKREKDLIKIEGDTKLIKSNNKSLIDSPMQTIPKNNQIHSNCFSLKTLYPGLITGVGIEHEAGIEGELKLGVHFDYTTGAPVIYGSSVKGVLASYIEEYLIDQKHYSKDEAKYLAKDIFEGMTYQANTMRYEPKPIYQRDVFFDAVIVSGNRKKQILAMDTLAPHGNDPLKNPVPISFLKIAAGVTLEFRFKLCESKVAGQVLSIENKLELFKEILTMVGIGAKTNVGYGQLETV